MIDGPSSRPPRGRSDRRQPELLRSDPSNASRNASDRMGFRRAEPAARDDRRRPEVRRWCGVRRRSPGDRGIRDRGRQDGQGLRRRPLLRDRDRRRGRTGGRDREAVPARARALREDHGRPALARGQGEPARADDPLELPDGDPGSRRGAAVRGLRRRRSEGRIFYYDATGGRWEEDDFHTTGSGGRAAKTSLKKRWRPGLERADALAVAIEALVDASQEDAATGGLDAARGIFPTVSSSRRTERDDVRRGRDRARRTSGVVGGGTRELHAVRAARATHEGPLRVRAQGDRPRQVGRWGSSTPTGSCSSRRTRAPRCTRSARSTTGSRSPASGSTASSRTSGSAGSGSPTCAGTRTGARTCAPGTSRTRTRRRSPRSSPSR